MCHLSTRQNNANEKQRSKIKRTLNFKHDSHQQCFFTYRRLLLQIHAQDTIAIEIKYHKSCYVQYVRAGALAKLEEQNCEDKDIASESYNRAFSNIREYVKNTVLRERKAVKMSELLERYIRKLSQEGVNAPSYRSSKLKNHLIKSH